MATLQLARRAPKTNRLPRIDDSLPPAVTAEKVRKMLLEIAYILHATRVISQECREQREEP